MGEGVRRAAHTPRPRPGAEEFGFDRRLDLQFFFSSRRRHTRLTCDWSSDVCSSDLPLNGRSFDNLMTLNPGIFNYVLKSPQTSTSNGNTFSVDGRRPSDNVVLLNGVEYTGTSQLAVTPGGVSGNLLGIDAVREFNVLTDTYGAEYGKRAGAQVNVVTQSGSNAIHGTAFEFLRNNVLNTAGIFDQ